MYRNVQYLLLVILLAFAIISNASAEHIKYEATSEFGINYELIIESEAPEVLKPLPVKLNVSDQDGNGIKGAQISCSLTMPAMAMPTNKPPVKATGVEGQYSSLFLLTMGGLWHVELTATYSSGETDRITIPVPGVVSDNDSDLNAKLEELFQEKNNSN